MSFVRAAVAAALLAGVGCGDEPLPEQPDAELYCLTDPRADDYVASMAKTSTGGLTVTLLSSVPGPPAKGDNDWLVRVADASGPQGGATIAVLPFMPDHGHGTSIKPVVEATGDPGEYSIGPVNLWMRGLWEVTLTIDAGGLTAEKVVFGFCIEG